MKLTKKNFCFHERAIAISKRISDFFILHLNIEFRSLMKHNESALQRAPVTAVLGNGSCLFRESHKTLTHFMSKKCRAFNVKGGGNF
jgi:hypothetical protein